MTGGLATSTESHFQHISALEVRDRHEAEGDAHDPKDALNIRRSRDVCPDCREQTPDKDAGDQRNDVIH